MPKKLRSLDLPRGTGGSRISPSRRCTNTSYKPCVCGRNLFRISGSISVGADSSFLLSVGPRAVFDIRTAFLILGP